MKLTNDTLQEVIEYAVEKHKGQRRRGDGRPYVLHPMSVLITLAKIKKSNNFVLIAIACMLHDVVEDCGVTIEEIAEKFGHRVSSLVSELTSNKDDMEKAGGKTKYLAEKMVTMSSYALRIKLADRLDNVEDLDPDKDFKKLIETAHILERLKERKLTATHKKLIKLIEKKIYGGKNRKKRAGKS